MHEPTDIERKSLEAHVELCAQRYNALEAKLGQVESKIEDLKHSIEKIGNILDNFSNKNNDRLIGWAIGIIGTLGAALAWMITHYVLK